MDDYEAIKSFDVAIEAINNKDYEKAKKFLMKSLRIQYSDKAKNMLDQCEKFLSHLDNQKHNIEQLSTEILGKSNYYEIMELKKDASENEIKEKYKELGTKLNKSKANSSQVNSAFRKLAQIYTCLIDKEKRKIYDEHGNEENFKENYHEYFKDDAVINPDNVFEAVLYELTNSNGNNVKNNTKLKNSTSTKKRPKFALILIMLATLCYILYIKKKSSGISKVYSNISSLDRITPYTEILKTAKKRIEYYVTKEVYEVVIADLDLISELENYIEDTYWVKMKKECQEITEVQTYITIKLNQNIDEEERRILISEQRSLDFSPCKVSNSLFH